MLAPQAESFRRSAPRSRSLPPLRAADAVKAGQAERSVQKLRDEQVLIYLDVDGVLNTTEQRAARQHLDNELIASLRCILEAVPESAIVVSSSWRLGPPLMEALEARLAAEGVKAPVGVTGQATLPQKDLEDRGDIDAELARLAAQRALEIQASVAARQPLAWIAIDDLDLRPPSHSTLCMGYPPRTVKADVPRVGDAPDDANGRALPPLAPRRPFSLGERRAVLPKHPLMAQLPRRLSRGKAKARLDKWIEPHHFVHTSEAAGLTSERAECAIGLLRAQLARSKGLTKAAMKTCACSH